MKYFVNKVDSLVFVLMVSDMFSLYHCRIGHVAMYCPHFYLKAVVLMLAPANTFVEYIDYAWYTISTHRLCLVYRFYLPFRALVNLFLNFMDKDEHKSKLTSRHDASTDKSSIVE